MQNINKLHLFNIPVLICFIRSIKFGTNVELNMLHEIGFIITAKISAAEIFILFERSASATNFLFLDF